MTRTVALSLTLMLAPVVAAGGQAVPHVQSGQWVRVSTKFLGGDPDWLVGHLADLTPSYLVVDPDGAARLAVMRGSLTQVQRSEGWVSRTGRGTLVGALVGLSASLFLNVVADCSEVCLVGVPLGAGLGRAVGSWASGHGWTAVPLDRLDEAFSIRRVARWPIRLPLGF